MHISDGVLSTAVVAVTYASSAGVVAYALKGVKTEEIPKIALMTGAFFVGSAIRVPLGPTSVHLMLTGFIGLVTGRRAPISILIALLLQFFLLHFGGISSMGANLFMTALPAVLVGKIFLPLIVKYKNKALLISAAAGLLTVVSTVIILSITLVQSNLRFGVGPFSTVRILAVAHMPLMIVEAVITAFAIQIILKIRPGFLYDNQIRNEVTEHENI